MLAEVARHLFIVLTHSGETATLRLTDPVVSDVKMVPPGGGKPKSLEAGARIVNFPEPVVGVGLTDWISERVKIARKERATEVKRLVDVAVKAVARPSPRRRTRRR